MVPLKEKSNRDYDVISTKPDKLVDKYTIVYVWWEGGMVGSGFEQGRLMRGPGTMSYCLFFNTSTILPPGTTRVEVI